MPDRVVDSRSAPAAVSWRRRADAAAAPVPAVAEEKTLSPPTPHALPPQKTSPLHEKILKTVDELKGDLSELFNQSPEAKPRTRRARRSSSAPAASRSSRCPPRCATCSAVLFYSYRDLDRKKTVDQCTTAGSSPARHVGARPSEQLLQNGGRAARVKDSSFDTIVAAGEETAARPHSHSLHRLMEYGSASELLLRRSPSLYEYGSSNKRSVPPSDASRRHEDRKGKGFSKGCGGNIQ
ncbi:uncharacterized protein [Aegilops tauschii subsp. strangulata]|uniref:uncharacterized protein n=1 Tax=Aegilops tauschii subsp. strangulata TaxID=200361 RepID=UPI001ABC97D8|nr:uncharacterized protein LOC120969224 [Aegilops tauschii subsp. strangulata]